MVDESAIKEGDDVLISIDGRKRFLVRIRQGEKLHTHKGFVAHDDILGKKFGETVKTNLGVEFFLLRPFIYDYIMKAARRTQISYPKDASLILTYAGVGPGSRIVEAGTGSGALTICMAYYVRPTGRIYTYEIRPEFMEVAKKNIDRVGLLQYVEMKSKDVTQGIDEAEVDAVVLDLATPWLAIPHAYRALKGGGALASFSPTIEQVIKTVEALEKEGFLVTDTIECLIRRMKVRRGETRPETFMVGHTGYLTFARKVVRN